MHFIGIDIGGTKISICLGDKTGKIYNTYRIKTPENKEDGIKSLQENIDKLLKEKAKTIEDVQAIGICCPGPICVKEGRIIDPPNLKGWHHTEIVSIFEEKYKKPIFLNNDANAAAIAEWEFGNRKKLKNLIYLTMSTGMGGGIIIQDQLVQGICDTAGEIGHFVLDIYGPMCSCGQKGCFEAFCGGVNVAKRVKEQIQKEEIHTKILEEANNDPANIDMIAIIEAMKKNDPYALGIWEEFVLRAAQGIGTIIMTLNPDAIILGTIAIHTKSLFLEPLKKKLPLFCWKAPLESCIIEASILGEGISELSSLALAIYGMEGKS